MRKVDSGLECWPWKQYFSVMDWNDSEKSDSAAGDSGGSTTGSMTFVAAGAGAGLREGLLAGRLAGFAAALTGLTVVFLASVFTLALVATLATFLALALLLGREALAGNLAGALRVAAFFTAGALEDFVLEVFDTLHPLLDRRALWGGRTG